MNNDNPQERRNAELKAAVAEQWRKDEAARQEAIKPDLERLSDWADRLEDVLDSCPTISNVDVVRERYYCSEAVRSALSELRQFIENNAGEPIQEPTP